MRNRLVTLLLGVAILGTSSAASAQNPQTRSGLWGNIGFGIGSYGCEGCGSRESGGAGTFALGGTLSRKVLLGAGVNVWTKEVNGVDVTASTVTAMIRFYPSATGGFFLVGGLGYGALQLSSGGTSISESGAGAVLGLGVDIRVGKKLSLTPFWNGNGISIDGGNANFGQLGISLTVH
jgi:hypothetical protein